MDPEEFFQARQADWQTLTALLNRSRKNIRQLTPADVNELGRLYRAATADLALAQREFPHHRLTTFLNQLVAQAHAVVYRQEPLTLKRLARFATSGFPRVYRQTFPFTLAAALLFIIPALVAASLTAWQPDAARWILPVHAQNLIDTIEEQQLWTNIPVEERPYASSFIMTHNIQVSFLAFGSGVLGGILTTWIIIHNGLLLGGVTGLTAHYDIGFELWTFVIGHGVVEISVIFMAGGSGLMLGWAVLQPGLLRRRDALALAARRAVRLLIGAMPLLVLAGLIEGFISPAETISWPVKWMVGLGSGLLLYSYLWLAGRS